VTWVPLRESWGVQHISPGAARLAYARALLHLTKALDQTRPVVSNDGWEHAESDIWTIHDYGTTRAELEPNYRDHHAVEDLMTGLGPLGRRMIVTDALPEDRPVVVTEFGGVSYVPDKAEPAWGYATAGDTSELEQHVRDLFEALQDSPVLAGFCYTQLTDTLQEANGLADQWRKPKLPIETIRAFVLGHGVDTSSHRRPKTPEELPVPTPPSRHAGYRQTP